jgi:DNA-binding PadR family transcriptional regulator
MHALLGLIIDRPGYPYELGDRLQRRLGGTWVLNSGQLYQTVRRLEREGWIARVEAPAGRRDRHVFAVTPDGEAEFERWFDGPTEFERPPRRALALKVTLAGGGRLARVARQLEADRRRLAELLADRSRARDAISLQAQPVNAGHALLRLNLTWELLQLEAELRWAAEAIELIAWLARRDALRPCASSRAGRAPRSAKPVRDRSLD